MIEKVVHGLMSGGWKRGTVSGPQRLQPNAWTAPDLSATAPVLDSVTTISGVSTIGSPSFSAASLPVFGIPATYRIDLRKYDVVAMAKGINQP